MKIKSIKIRPAIWVGEIALAVLGWQAMQIGLTEVAIACVVGITALLPKLVESEEKGE